MTARDILAEIETLAPSVAFGVSRKVDHYFSWDGDGPDPREEGYDPYDVRVQAIAIVAGKRREGEAYLGGCYFLQGEPTDDVHGYLPQMLDEASRELRLAIPLDSPIQFELEAVLAFLAQEMRDRYESQSNPIAGASDNPA